MSEAPRYYVPHTSPWPIIGSFSLFVTAFGGASFIHQSTEKVAAAGSYGEPIFYTGVALIAFMMFGWFGAVVREGRAGLYSPQMDRSFRWGMSWFIFSEVMFFAAFFGALFYIRTFAVPWLGGEGDKGVANMLWEGFEYNWPLLQNPDSKLFPPPTGVIDPWHLPLVNTILLVSSSFTVTFAHHALKKNHRGALKAWLAATIVLGLSFLFFQVEEYIEAYTELGLTLGSGIYGATFFMLTGFHGAHVTLGTLILTVMLVRILRGHFDADKHFGFEAAAWYWHFVDVVWLFLFFAVYVWGGWGAPIHEVV